jgi:hypothetical protein
MALGINNAAIIAPIDENMRVKKSKEGSAKECDESHRPRTTSSTVAREPSDPAAPGRHLLSVALFLALLTRLPLLQSQQAAEERAPTAFVD